MSQDKMRADWERLESVMAWSGKCSHQFAIHIGLRNTENLYQIKRGNHGISRKLAETIVTFFPQISFLWLFRGDGDMFVPESTESLQTPYYDVDIEANIRAVEHLEPRSTMMLPTSIDVDFAMIYKGDAMGDVIPTNSIVMVKKVTPEQMILGKEYLICTPHLSIVRIYRADNEGEERVRLVAVADKKYDDMLIAKEQIEAVYHIKAKLIINN